MMGGVGNDSKSHSITEVNFNSLSALTVGLAAGFILPKAAAKWLYPIVLAIKSGRSPHIPSKMVIVVRSDVAMSAGKVASQCAHAAVQCSLKANNGPTHELNLWLSQGQPKIVLRGGPGGDALLMQLCSKASQNGLITSLIRDAGKTQVQAGTYTALGIGPGPAPLIDKITGHLKTF